LGDVSVKFDINVKKKQKSENECNVCGLDYHIESELKRHMALRHAQETSTAKHDGEHLLDEEFDKLNNSEVEGSLLSSNESLVIDDVSFSLLESVVKKSTQNGRNKSKRRKNSRRKRSRKEDIHSKTSRSEEEISIDEDVIVIVPEVTMAPSLNSDGEQSDSEDDVFDPDFEPPSKRIRRSISQKDITHLRSSTINKRTTQKSKVRKKSLGKAQKIFECIPKSTKIIYTPEADDMASNRMILEEKLHRFCSICKGTFLSKNDFDWHVEKFHRKTQDNFMTKCSRCTLKFHSSEALNKHMKTHLIKCKHCNFMADSKQKTDEHIRQYHNYKCQKCRKSFEEKIKLERHMKNIHSFKCKDCSIMFDSKIKHDVHIKEHHSPEKTLDMRQNQEIVDSSCAVCEDEFSWPEPEHLCYYTRNNIRPGF